jgi:hypothetical protein
MHFECLANIREFVLKSKEFFKNKKSDFNFVTSYIFKLQNICLDILDT